MENVDKQNVTPRPNMLIGITHTPSGEKIIREPKTLKVGIGLPRGKALDVFVNAEGRWVVRVGRKGAGGRLEFDARIFDTKKDAIAGYREAWKTVPDCNYPRKITYFTFTRPIINKEGAEIYVPDFEAIESHSIIEGKPVGPPTEIDILFLSDEPFAGGYQMWSASELRCFGDGENALRVLSLAQTAEEKELAAAALKAKKKYFPIIGGCWTMDCPYSKEGVHNGNPTPSPCKPSADLRFQLARHITVGGTTFFHTSSFRSIAQVWSSVERIRELTGGRVAGIPLKMVLRSHKTKHNGQTAIQPNVSIEFRATDMESVKKNLIDQAWKFREAAGLAARAKLISAPSEEETAPDTDYEPDSPMSPEAMAGEFYPDTEEGAVTEESGNRQQPPAGVATQAKQNNIAEQLATRRATEPEAPQQEPRDTATAAQQQQQPGAAAGAPAFPWTDRQGMNKLLMEQKSRLGQEIFDSALTKLSLMLGALKYNDPKALELYELLRSTAAPGAIGNQGIPQQQVLSPTQQQVPLSSDETPDDDF